LGRDALRPRTFHPPATTPPRGAKPGRSIAEMAFESNRAISASALHKVVRVGSLKPRGRRTCGAFRGRHPLVIGRASLRTPRRSRTYYVFPGRNPDVLPRLVARPALSTAGAFVARPAMREGLRFRTAGAHVDRS